jgi:hypothetical protein
VRALILFALIFGFARWFAHTEGSESKLKNLYDRHCWFELRDTITEKAANAPDFYKAAVAAAFNRFPEAEDGLGKTTENHPSADVDLEAREKFVGLYFRLGKYHDALFKAQFLCLPTFRILSPYKSRRVLKRSPSIVKMEINDGNLVLPIAINGIKGKYIFDNRKEVRRSIWMKSGAGHRYTTQGGSP